jgi:membrane-associated phospholipid phosphatase
MKKILVPVLVALLLLPLGAADEQQARTDEAEYQTEIPAQNNKEKGNVIGHFWSDHARILTYPLRLKAKDLAVIVPVGLLSWVMINNDETMYAGIKDFQSRNTFIDKASPLFSNMCQGAPFGIAGLFILEGLVFDDEKGLQTGSMALQAMLHSFVVVQLVKHLTGRTRPSFTEGVDHWAGPRGFFKRYEEGQWAYYDAYFSGHTITIWALATVVARQYNQTPLIPIISYSLATLGGMATVTEDLHWVSDVFLGAVVGYAIASFVIKQHKMRNMQITPVMQPRGLGISLTLRF